MLHADASSTGLFYAGIQQTSTFALRLTEPSSAPTFAPATPKPTVCP
jgi:hypothetical protein